MFPKHVDGDRYVGQAIEFLDREEFERVGGVCGSVEKGGSTVYWNRVLHRDETGSFHFNYDHPSLESRDSDGSDPETAERLDVSAFDGAADEHRASGDATTADPAAAAPDRSEATDDVETADRSDGTTAADVFSTASAPTDEGAAAPPSRPGASESPEDAPWCDMRTFHRIAERTDRPVQAVEAEFHRKLRYVRYLEREDLDDFDELFAFVADLETNEAATVERLRRRGDS